MQLELYYGLYFSMILSGVVGFLFTLYYIISSASDFFGEDDFIINLSIFITTIINSFCVIYPLANLFYNYYHLEHKDLFHFISFLRPEFSSGIIALRVTSLIVGIYSFKSLLESTKYAYFINTPDEVKKVFNFPETKDELEITTELDPFRNRLAHLFLNILQYGIFQLGIIILWVSNLFGESTIYTAGLAWLIFYFVDDWRIIFTYSMSLKGRILKSHRRKILVINIVIVLLGGVNAYFVNWIALCVYIISSYFIIRLWLLLKRGVVGNMIIVTPLDWQWFNNEYNFKTGEKKKKKKQ